MTLINLLVDEDFPMFQPQQSPMGVIPPTAVSFGQNVFSRLTSSSIDAPQTTLNYSGEYSSAAASSRIVGFTNWGICRIEFRCRLPRRVRPATCSHASCCGRRRTRGAYHREQLSAISCTASDLTGANQPLLCTFPRAGYHSSLHPFRACRNSLCTSRVEPCNAHDVGPDEAQ